MKAKWEWKYIWVIFDLDSGWMLEVSFMSLPIYSQRKKKQLDWRLGKPQDLSERSGEEKISTAINRTWAIQPIVHRYAY
jgi:hypothetical protein